MGATKKFDVQLHGQMSNECRGHGTGHALRVGGYVSGKRDVELSQGWTRSPAAGWSQRRVLPAVGSEQCQSRSGPSFLSGAATAG